MTKVYDVAVKVVSVKGHCANGMKPGLEWVVGRHTVDGICHSAFHALYPYYRILRYGGSMPFAEDPDSVTVCCADPVNNVLFELRRIAKDPS